MVVGADGQLRLCKHVIDCNRLWSSSQHPTLSSEWVTVTDHSRAGRADAALVCGIEPMVEVKKATGG
jgi:hypothetical protein